MNRRLLIESCLASLICIVPWCVFAAPSLLQDKTFAFRDGAHYYPPLFELVASEWEHSIPLWNDREERGRPLLADPTAAVLYPPQWLFLKFPSTPLAYTGYVWFHVGLAVALMYLAAKRMRLASSAAAFAAISYGYGGSILFQTCNIPYLIGAAWLPLAISAILELVHYQNRAGTIKLATSIAMMVLGGDPQLAYLVGWSALLAVTISILPRRSGLTFAAQIRVTMGLLKPVIWAGLLAGLISAAQWIPTLAWSMKSERIVSLDSGAKSGQFDDAPDRSPATERIEPVTHQSARYFFSVGPWRWVELFWSNASGRPFPTNARWISAFPAEGRFWTPSLYMGLAPALLGLGAMRFRRGRLAERWLTVLVILGAFGSLGRYGIGWIVAEIVNPWGGSVDASQHPVGGLYWLMVHLLPGFGLFRYPAKLWTWTAAGLALLAAQRWHDLCHQSKSVKQGMTAPVYLSATALLLLLCIAFWQVIALELSHTQPDMLFGPLVVPEVRNQILMSLVAGLVVGLLFVILVSRGRGRPTHLAAWLLVALTAVELTICHRWLVPMVPRANVASTQVDGANVIGHAQLADRILTYREAKSSGWYPESWSRTSATDRLLDCTRWDRLTQRPKYPLNGPIHLLTSSTSFSSLEQMALEGLLLETAATERNRLPNLLSALGVQVLISPIAVASPSWQLRPESPELRKFDGEVYTYLSTSHRPRAWIVHKSIQQSAPRFPSTRSTSNWLRSVLERNGEFRDLLAEVVIEGPQKDVRATTDRTRSPVAAALGITGSDAQVLESSGNQLLISARLSRGGWLVVNDSYDDGWHAVVANVESPDEWSSATVHRANGIMRAVRLGPGEYLVRLRYQPAGWRIGCFGSLLGVVWLLVLIGSDVRDRRQLGQANDVSSTASP